MIEFALGIGLLWLLFTGAYKYGYAFYQYNKLQTYVSHAALMASRMDYDVDHPNLYISAVKNMVIYGDPYPPNSARPIVTGLSTSNVDVNVNPEGSSATPTDVTITVQNFLLPTLFQSYQLINKPRVTTVYMGKVTCSSSCP